MTPSRSAAIAVTCGTAPDTTASCSTLSIAEPSMPEFMAASPWLASCPGWPGCGDSASLVPATPHVPAWRSARRPASPQQVTGAAHHALLTDRSHGGYLHAALD